MPNPTTVRLHAHLDVPLAALVAHGLDPKHRRVCMGPDHGNRITGLPLFTDSKSHNRGAVPGEVVLPARLAC